jgi:uncharacterized protein (TIGR00288 family)
MKQEQKIAVLIDAENASMKSLASILTELSKHGHIITKRAYGDWSSNHLKNWSKTMNELVIQPIQQFSYTQGKNSSDAALIIDAMDLLYSNNFDAFALISSDSDFTKLASRLKESQIHVYGVGEKKTPPAFINACDDFIYVEVLRQPNNKIQEPKKEVTTTTKTKSKSNYDITKDKELLLLLQNAVDDCADDDGWAALAECGSLIKKQFPDFDARNYGFSKLSRLFEESKAFDIWRKNLENSDRKVMFLRDISRYGSR